MLLPSVRSSWMSRCVVRCIQAPSRPVPAIVEDRPVQRPEGGEEQGGSQDLRKVLSSGFFLDSGLSGAGTEAPRLCVFILLSYPCSVCVH